MRRSNWWIVSAIGLCVALTAPAFPGDRAEGGASEADEAAPATDAAAGDPELARILRGFEIAPVPLRNPIGPRVGLGSYIVNAQGACNDCHTNPPFAPGGDPFLGQPEQINVEGYLAGGTEFGPFVSRNLTPVDGRPAGLTFQEFRHAIRTGHDFKELHPQISPRLQVMPWVVYKNMTDRDLRAIYAYLSSIPSIPSH